RAWRRVFGIREQQPGEPFLHLIGLLLGRIDSDPHFPHAGLVLAVAVRFVAAGCGVAPVRHDALPRRSRSVEMITNVVHASNHVWHPASCPPGHTWIIPGDDPGLAGLLLPTPDPG